MITLRFLWSCSPWNLALSVKLVFRFSFIWCLWRQHVLVKSDSIKTKPHLPTHKVWSESFGRKLAIRQPTSHTVCQICCRHKYILKKLSDDLFGRECQMKMFQQHLKRQYADRCLYWAARAASRLNALTADSTQILAVIADGMDHSKFRYPRSVAMTSKQYDQFLRPHFVYLPGPWPHGSAVSFRNDSSKGRILLLGSFNLLSALHCLADRPAGHKAAGPNRQHMSRIEK